MLTVTILEKRGHSVVVANDGKEALQELEKEAIDLVLMDLQMPEMDGLEATAAIREKEKSNGRHLPIVTMTAHAMKGDRERCLDGGMDDYLSKPIQAKALIQMVEKIVPTSVEAETSASDDRAQIPAALWDRNQPWPITISTDPRDIVEPARILANVDGDEGILRKIVELFLDDSQAVLFRIQDSIERQDTEALTCAAHSLKGAASNF